MSLLLPQLLLSCALASGQIQPPEPLPQPLPPAVGPVVPGPVVPGLGTPGVVVPAPGVPVGEVIVSGKAPTIKQLAASFVPLSGRHVLTVVHPISGKCVTFCVDLPACPLVCVRAYHRTLVFDYGCRKVEVVFRLFNRVDVRYL
jgi:hypothetical protein